MKKENEIKDIIITPTESLLKTVLQSIPAFVPFVNLFNDYQNKIQIQNIKDVLNSHDSQIEILKAMAINMQYLHSPERIKDILETVQKAKDELNEDKKKLYASYLTACCHIENDKSLNKRIFLDLIGRIDSFDFYIIKSISESNVFDDSINEISSSFFAQKHGIEKSNVEIHIEYLISLRLIEEYNEEQAHVIYPKNRYGSVGSRKWFGEKKIFYRLTNLGRALFEFISKAE